MENYFHILRVAGLISSIVFFYWIARNSISIAEKQEDDLDHGLVDKNLLEQSVKAFGRNTSSIVHFYGELSYFTPFSEEEAKDPRSLIGYISGSKNNIMITDPLCDQKDAKASIVAFTKFTQARGKTSLLFPIDMVTARQAAEIGYGILQVGKEPVFDLKSYSIDTIERKVQSAIRQVYNKGIIIEHLTFKEIQERGYEIELGLVLDEWLLSRRSEKMELLLEVSPFKYAEEKKYFIARSQNQIEAFLSCSPIFPRKGFFIHDLIRRPTAMNGIAEALNTAALNQFKSDGYEFASLGTAPLAGLDQKGANSNYKILNKILVHIFNSHKMFMQFKSLYSFKKKFKPTAEEPTYLAFYPPSLKMRDALTVIGLFSSQGPVGNIVFKIKRWLDGEQLPRPLISLVSPDVATLARPVPFSFYEFISRLKFTFLMFAMNVYTYATTTDMFGEINRQTVHDYAFSYGDFFAHKWFVLFTSNFLHFSYAHLLINMTMLFFFCGTLEFIGGSKVAFASFVISMNANIPSAMVILPILKMINVSAWQHVFSYTDVGASLGIMGCFGALIQFFKNKRQVLVLACLISMGFCVVNKEWFGIDHTFAILTGYFTGYLYLHRRYQLRGFQRFFASPAHPGQQNSPIPFRKISR